MNQFKSGIQGWHEKEAEKIEIACTHNMPHTIILSPSKSMTQALHRLYTGLVSLIYLDSYHYL